MNIWNDAENNTETPWPFLKKRMKDRKLATFCEFLQCVGCESNITSSFFLPFITSAPPSLFKCCLGDENPAGRKKEHFELSLVSPDQQRDEWTKYDAKFQSRVHLGNMLHKDIWQETLLAICPHLSSSNRTSCAL